MSLSLQEKTQALLTQAAAAVYQGDLTQAQQKCVEALGVQPEHPEVLNMLGVIAQRRGGFKEALELFERCVVLAPDNMMFYGNLCGALARLGQWERLSEVAARAMELEPGHANHVYYCALAEQEQYRPEAAIPLYQRCLELNPELQDAAINLVRAYMGVGEFKQALTLSDTILAKDPACAKARYNRALVLLRYGRFDEGFKEYEIRWEIPGLPNFPKEVAGVPRWDGREDAGKTLYVFCRQGFGDVIQFIRFLPQVKARGLKVVYRARDALHDLLTGVEGIDVLLKEADPLPACDYALSLMSLPHVLGLTPETIPAQVPYLQADAERIARWAPRLQQGRYKVGVNWAGSAKQENDYNRSCTLEAFKALFADTDITFYSLQKGREEDAIAALAAEHKNVVDLGPEIVDFSDSAAIITQLDLTISVCTSAAHVAGALGAPCWTVLSYAADWRWFEGREDSPWYPGMRLFRQKAYRDWPGVIGQVKAALAEWKAGG